MSAEPAVDSSLIDKQLDDLEKQLSESVLAEESKDTVSELPRVDNQHVDTDRYAGKSEQELREIGRQYSENLCSKSIVELLNYICGEDLFKGLPQCGNVGAKTNDGEELNFNYEVKSKDYVHKIPASLADGKGGPNDQVTEALGQLIKMYCIYYEHIMTQFIRTHEEEYCREKLKLFRPKPFLDGQANLWLSNTTDKVLGLVFRKNGEIIE